MAKGLIQPNVLVAVGKEEQSVTRPLQKYMLWLGQDTMFLNPNAVALCCSSLLHFTILYTPVCVTLFVI